MRRKAPWFPFYAADWNGDEQVRLLSLEAQGAYVRLLAHSWIERSIPADPDSIGVLLGDRRLGKKIWPALARFWEPKADEPGRLVNARLERERRAQDDYSAAQRERGKRGNESQVRTQVRTDGDRGGGAHAGASAHANWPHTRSQVAPPSDRSVQSEPKPEEEKPARPLVHPTRSTTAREERRAGGPDVPTGRGEPDPEEPQDGRHPEFCIKPGETTADAVARLRALASGPIDPRDTDANQRVPDALVGLQGRIYGEPQ